MKEHILDISLTAKNDLIAKENQNFFKKNGIFCINLMGAPGSGKTTLIEGLSEYFEGLVVIQGDVKSEVDTKRLRKKQIDSYQIQTHSGCHLNAHMIKKILEEINFSSKKYVIIENVGNLVCPAGVKLGQHINILCSATTEGYDKPEKYPHIFRDSQAIVLTKYDLIEAVKFNEEKYLKRLEKFGKKHLFNVDKENKESFKNLANFLK